MTISIKGIKAKILKLSYQILSDKNDYRNRMLIGKVSENSLLWNYGNVYSQLGQDGILAFIFRKLGISNGNFVEFGAWDGITISNCRFLYEKGWQGVFIEASKSRYKLLRNNYKDSKIITINEQVGAPNYGIKGNSLKDILISKNVDPSKIDFVSIDIDGPDLDVAMDLGFKPPVILVEGGSNFSPKIKDPISSEIATNNLQHPFGYIFKVCNENGYKLVAFHQDSYLVRNDLSEKFEYFSAEQLYADSWNFLTESHRNSLIELRNSKVIIDIEKSYFKDFQENPLLY